MLRDENLDLKVQLELAIRERDLIRQKLGESGIEVIENKPQEMFE